MLSTNNYLWAVPLGFHQLSEGFGDEIRTIILFTEMC